MARGWHFTKLSLSSALLLYFSGMCFVLYLYIYIHIYYLCFSVPSLELVDVPLTVSCPADHVPDWHPRTILLSMIEARSVNVKSTHNTKILLPIR